MTNSTVKMFREHLEAHKPAGRVADLSAIFETLANHETLIVALSTENQMLTRQLATQKADFEARISALEARSPPQLEGGRLSPNLTALECQIFHTPDLKPEQRRVKTEWSIRLTGWIGEKRAKPDINVKLFSGSRFYNQVMQLTHPDYAEQAAETIRDTNDALGGMLLAITKQAGRPYIPTQFCLLHGHLTDNPTVLVVMDGKQVLFTGFRPAKGEKAGKAKWYAKAKVQA